MDTREKILLAKEKGYSIKLISQLTNININTTYTE